VLARAASVLRDAIVRMSARVEVLMVTQARHVSPTHELGDEPSGGFDALLGEWQKCQLVGDQQDRFGLAEGVLNYVTPPFSYHHPPEGGYSSRGDTCKMIRARTPTCSQSSGPMTR
jgi:ABC-type protease/lipase transport system fused ATPase/permease subunit